MVEIELWSAKVPWVKQDHRWSIQVPRCISTRDQRTVFLKSRNHTRVTEMTLSVVICVGHGRRDLS